MTLTPSERFRPGKDDWIRAGAVALALFALYALTAPRTVALEDDGLFILSSSFLGIEHPPGYPLFTLIGHLFSQIPFWPVAYRIHLVSAVFGGLTGGAAWLCARSLVRGRLSAYVAAFALGLCPVFWSQSLIAEVYTLNTFFFLTLVFLGLQICPPVGESSEAVQRRLLPVMAFLFGLSLSNHWPLMLLVAPGFLILLWPVRGQIVSRLGLLSWLVILGLLPYVWMVLRSWERLPISFDGPLETLRQIWFFVSRAGYATVDHSPTATPYDKIKFFEDFAGQLVVQFAVIGTAVAAAGYAVQWRIFGRRIAAFLTAAFLGPSVVLILLLDFDYSSLKAHIFHVYPLPAYAVAALWMALGFAWLMQRMQRPGRAEVAVASVLVGVILAAGANDNLRASHDFGARYAQAMLKAFPRDAVVFTQGDADLAPLAYFHLIEGWRPDITLYHEKGLILGNRLVNPLETNDKQWQHRLSKMIDAQKNPVVFTLDAYTGYGRIERGLFSIIDKSSTDKNQVKVDIPEEVTKFLDERVVGAHDKNAWVAFLQAQLRRRYALDLARSLPRDRAPDAATRARLEALARDYYGALGLAQGLVLNPDGYSAGSVGALLERARQLVPSGIDKQDLSEYFYLRAVVRANLKDKTGAIQDFRTALSVWPSPDNKAAGPLRALYRGGGKAKALGGEPRLVEPPAGHPIPRERSEG